MNLQPKAKDGAATEGLPQHGPRYDVQFPGGIINAVVESNAALKAVAQTGLSPASGVIAKAIASGAVLPHPLNIDNSRLAYLQRFRQCRYGASG